MKKHYFRLGGPRRPWPQEVMSELRWRRRRMASCAWSGPGWGNSNHNGLEVGMHLKLAKNLTISSLGMSGRSGKGNWVWWGANGWVPGKVRLRSFCSGLTGTEVPLGVQPRAAPILTACHADSSSPILPAVMRHHVGTAVPITQGAPPFPGGGFDSLASCTGILTRQHKSVMSTPDNCHDRKSQKPEWLHLHCRILTESEVSLRTQYHLIAMEMKRMGLLFFF